jgi:hypothetical protein
MPNVKLVHLHAPIVLIRLHVPPAKHLLLSELLDLYAPALLVTMMMDQLPNAKLVHINVPLAQTEQLVLPVQLLPQLELVPPVCALRDTMMIDQLLNV